MLEWLLSKRQEMSVGKDAEKRELCTAGGMQFGKAIMENGVGFLQKTRNRTII